MNESMKRERAYRMQTLYRQSPNNISHQPRKIAVLAILLFALSGLVSGFAVGAFVHPGTGTGNTSNTDSLTTPGTQNTKTSTSTTQPQPVEFKYPSIEGVKSTEKADGSTFYTVSAQLNHVVDNNGHPVFASDLTCKLWLVQRIPDHTNFDLDTNSLKDTNALQNQLTGTVGGQTFLEIPVLQFDTSTQQIQSCTTYNQVTWKYQVSTSAVPGDYDLVVLFDWQGKHYNWSWVNIEIKKAD